LLEEAEKSNMEKERSFIQRLPRYAMPNPHPPTLLTYFSFPF